MREPVEYVLGCNVLGYKFLQNVVFWDDHVVSKCLGINYTFFRVEWVVRVEVK